jgi:hypothetical protein
MRRRDRSAVETIASVVSRPTTRATDRAAGNAQIVDASGDGRAEAVRQDLQRRFLRPARAGDRRAMRRAVVSMEGVHVAARQSEVAI